MGTYLAQSHVKVGLLALDDTVEYQLIQRLNSVHADDAGRVDVLRFQDMVACDKAVHQGLVTAVCIGVEAFTPAQCVAFISNIRVTRETVPFCLVGAAAFVDKMPGYEKAWQKRFEHYYKLRTDTSPDDFAVNAGLLRDLFLADDIKARALGQYVTTPGKVVKLKSAPTYGYWKTIIAGLVGALGGGAIGPVMQHYWGDGQQACAKADQAGGAAGGASRPVLGPR